MQDDSWFYYTWHIDEFSSDSRYGHKFRRLHVESPKKPDPAIFQGRTFPSYQVTFFH